MFTMAKLYHDIKFNLQTFTFILDNICTINSGCFELLYSACDLRKFFLSDLQNIGFNIYKYLPRRYAAITLDTIIDILKNENICNLKIDRDGFIFDAISCRDNMSLIFINEHICKIEKEKLISLMEQLKIIGKLLFEKVFHNNYKLVFTYIDTLEKNDDFKEMLNDIPDTCPNIVSINEDEINDVIDYDVCYDFKFNLAKLEFIGNILPYGTINICRNKCCELISFLDNKRNDKTHEIFDMIKNYETIETLMNGIIRTCILCEDNYIFLGDPYMCVIDRYKFIQFVEALLEIQTKYSYKLDLIDYYSLDKYFNEEAHLFSCECLCEIYYQNDNEYIEYINYCLDKCSFLVYETD